ncbi:hypothetical protein G4B88_023341 [Cannabis sativa]|uniref:Uncharacterized protein n=1 Tax=Cannabis sativa TaxID=3483 RepID=A0A7J6I0N1_CANSA|nr:hypothetical protein G4B88_023341 [Cannabis sativa]
MVLKEQGALAKQLLNYPNATTKHAFNIANPMLAHI